MTIFSDKYMCMLELSGIYKSFFKQRILEDVSFTVASGEITGLLGPNGAGKTTIIRIINKIFTQDQGHVSFNGSLLTQKHIAQIGYLPEERGLYKSMTVEDQAVFLGRLRGMTKQDVKTALNYWLERFDIENWRKKRIEELSKGMAQKVQFICTVLHDPELLILDEPFSGFDPINIELIRSELLKMKAAGKTIILSTHNMKSVEEICDRVVLIHEGRKVLEGNVKTLQHESKQGVYALTFKGNMIAFANALWVGYEIIDKEVHSDDLITVYLKMRSENELNDLLNTVIPHVKIQKAAEVLPSMEEVFMQQINKKREEASHE